MKVIKRFFLKGIRWKFWKHPLYCMKVIVVTITAIFAGYFFVALVLAHSERQRFDKKYKKVIKKGIFWDSIEYHER